MDKFSITCLYASTIKTILLVMNDCSETWIYVKSTHIAFYKGKKKIVSPSTLSFTIFSYSILTLSHSALPSEFILFSSSHSVSLFLMSSLSFSTTSISFFNLVWIKTNSSFSFLITSMTPSQFDSSIKSWTTYNTYLSVYIIIHIPVNSVWHMVIIHSLIYNHFLASNTL